MLVCRQPCVWQIVTSLWKWPSWGETLSSSAYLWADLSCHWAPCLSLSVCPNLGYEYPISSYMYMMNGATRGSSSLSREMEQLQRPNFLCLHFLNIECWIMKTRQTSPGQIIYAWKGNRNEVYRDFFRRGWAPTWPTFQGTTILLRSTGRPIKCKSLCFQWTNISPDSELMSNPDPAALVTAS